MGLDDAFDDTFDLPTESESEPIYDIADDGGFDFGIESAPPRTEKTITVSPDQGADLQPGDMAIVKTGRNRSFVIAGTRGIAVLESASGDDGKNPDYEITTLQRSTTGNLGVVPETSRNAIGPGPWEEVGGDYIPSGEVEVAKGFRGDGSEARRMFERFASVSDVGALSAGGERKWCEDTGSGPEYASHPLAKEKAYSFVASHPELSLRAVPPDDPDEREDWEISSNGHWDNDFEGLDPSHHGQVFARHRLSALRESFYYADGPDIYRYDSLDDTTERIEP